MEDIPVKAIVIGVSLFVTMLTFSVIIIYYTTAMQVADTVTNRTDIASQFDYIVNSDNFETTLNGVEIRSLIRKYVGSDKVKINIVAINGETVNEYQDITNTWLDDNGLLKESKMDIINPVWTNHVEKVETYSLTTLNIRLDVDK